MAADMNYVMKLSTETESGDVVHLLSELAGEPEERVEQMLQTGMTPWELARELCVLGEFRDTLLERMLTQLCEMVQEHQISQQYADYMIARFEMNVPAEESEYTW